MVDEDWTAIRIQGPLPMGVAGALMKMIGTAWPEAMIESNSRYALDMPKGWNWHVYRNDTPQELYMGFFIDKTAAEGWVDVQKEGAYEVTERKPKGTMVAGRAEEAGDAAGGESEEVA